MYNFFEDKLKYRVICTDDRKHVLLVNHTKEEIETYAKENGLKIIDQEPKFYVVHVSNDPVKFMFGLTTLIRRLAPSEPFDSLYGLFYKSKDRRLATKAVYLSSSDEKCPFVSVDSLMGFSCIKDVFPHA